MELWVWALTGGLFQDARVLLRGVCKVGGV
jgi:hypothetical protein